MRERDLQTRVDVTYPFDKKDEEGNLIELIEEAVSYDIQFVYQKGKKGTPLFKISATRVDRTDEQYEIDIVGHKRIKNVMK